MSKTYTEINEKIRKGEVVVVTAEEMIDIVEEKGTKKAAQEVDVVTTGTFSPMCSSGAFLNFGHAKPRRHGLMGLALMLVLRQLTCILARRRCRKMIL